MDSAGHASWSVRGRVNLSTPLFQHTKAARFGSLQRDMHVSAAPNVVLPGYDHSHASPLCKGALVTWPLWKQARDCRTRQTQQILSSVSLLTAGSEVDVGLTVLLVSVAVLVVASILCLIGLSSPVGPWQDARHVDTSNATRSGKLGANDSRQTSRVESTPLVRQSEAPPRSSSEVDLKEIFLPASRTRDVDVAVASAAAPVGSMLSSSMLMPPNKKGSPDVPGSPAATPIGSARNALVSQNIIMRKLENLDLKQATRSRINSQGSGASTPKDRTGWETPSSIGAPTLSDISKSDDKLRFKLPSQISDSSPEVRFVVECLDSSYSFGARMRRKEQTIVLSTAVGNADLGSIAMSEPGSMVIRGVDGAVYGKLERHFLFKDRFSYRLSFGEKEVAVFRGKGSPGSSGQVVMASSLNGSKLADASMVPIATRSKIEQDHRRLPLRIEPGVDAALVVLCYLGVLILI